jgi:hypothetical protein
VAGLAGVVSALYRTTSQECLSEAGATQGFSRCLLYPHAELGRGILSNPLSHPQSVVQAADHRAATLARLPPAGRKQLPVPVLVPPGAVLFGSRQRDIDGACAAALGTDAAAALVGGWADWCRQSKRAVGEPQVRKTPEIGPEVGPTLVFHSCVPTGMDGPTCIFWANLTPFSPQRTLERGAAAVAGLWRLVVAGGERGQMLQRVAQVLDAESAAARAALAPPPSPRGAEESTLYWRPSYNPPYSSPYKKEQIRPSYRESSSRASARASRPEFGPAPEPASKAASEASDTASERLVVARVGARGAGKAAALPASDCRAAAAAAAAGWRPQTAEEELVSPPMAKLCISLRATPLSIENPDGREHLP